MMDSLIELIDRKRIEAAREDKFDLGNTSTFFLVSVNFPPRLHLFEIRSIFLASSIFKITTFCILLGLEFPST